MSTGFERDGVMTGQPTWTERRLLKRAGIVVCAVSGTSRARIGGVRQFAGLRLASRETREMCG